MNAKLIAFFLFFFGSVSIHAQFKLSGKIEGYTGKESLKLNIPNVYGYNKENDIKIPIDKNGNFNLILPLQEKRFGDLIFERTFYTCLLTPGKSLVISCRTKDLNVHPISGTAALENRLITSLGLRKQPFFLQKEKSFYDSLTTIVEIEEQVIKPWRKIRDRKIMLTKSALIADEDKALIIAETKYNAINFLQELRYTITDRKLANDFYLHLYDGLPTTPEVFSGRSRILYVCQVLSRLSRSKSNGQ